MTYGEYLTNIFGCKVQKISVDAGFSCPNRDGKLSTGGCKFCNNRSFVASAVSGSEHVEKSLQEGIRFFSRKYKDMKYLAYLQAYSNTYAPVGRLRDIYCALLKHPDVLGLVIATRPDCLDEKVVALLQELGRQTYVCVELGVESIYNNTLAAINRHHTVEQAEEAIARLHHIGLPVCAHLIMGLPGENREMQLATAEWVNGNGIELLKLHQLQIVKGSTWGDEFEAKGHVDGVTLYSVEDYANFCREYLTLLDERVIVERLTSQSPADMLLAPKWGLKNYEFMNLVNAVR